VRFAGIGGEVVELRQREVDELESPLDDPAQRRPAPRKRRGERLEVGGVAFPGRAEEGTAREARGRGYLADLEDGWKNVHVPRGRPPGGAGHARSPDDQRNVERRFIGKEPVSLFTVVAQRLAMVGGHDDERGFARGPDVRKERTER